MDLNHRPLPYQGSALTKLSYGPEIACRDYPTPYPPVLWGRSNHSEGLSQRAGTHCTTGDLTPVYGPGSRELQRGGVDCLELAWCEHSQHYGTTVAQPVVNPATSLAVEPSNTSTITGCCDDQLNPPYRQLAILVLFYSLR